MSEEGGARTGFIKSVPCAPNARAGGHVIDMGCSQPIGQNGCGTLPIVFICQKRHPVVKCDACRTCRPAQICFFHSENDVHGRSFSSHCSSSGRGVPTGRPFRRPLSTDLEIPWGGAGSPALPFPRSSFTLTTPDPRASFVRIVTRCCCAASPEILLPAARIEDDNEPHLSHTPGSIVRGRSTSAPALH